MEVSCESQDHKASCDCSFVVTSLASFQRQLTASPACPTVAGRRGTGEEQDRTLTRTNNNMAENETEMVEGQKEGVVNIGLKLRIACIVAKSELVSYLLSILFTLLPFCRL